jgi:uncharacterized protein
MSPGRVIDGLQFARAGADIEGTLGPDELPRLADSGCGVDEIAYRIEGGINGDGKPSLGIRASGMLGLVCQRCLGPLEFPVEVDVELELSESPAEIENAGDDVDRVLATHDMDVAALVEDELILALPFSPKHEACEMAEGADRGERVSPFGVLEQLKRRRSEQ